MKRKLITGLVLLFISGLIVLFLTPDYRQGEPSVHGQAAKDFQFNLNGKATRLSDLRGHVVVLNFWATWCQPCVDEAPSFNRLQQVIEPLGGIVLGINYGVNDSQDSYKKFLRDYKIGYPTYFDQSERIALSYGTSMIPETYIIGSDGKLDRKIVGDQDWASPEIISYISSIAPNQLHTHANSLTP